MYLRQSHGCRALQFLKTSRVWGSGRPYALIGTVGTTRGHGSVFWVPTIDSGPDRPIWESISSSFSFKVLGRRFQPGCCFWVDVVFGMQNPEILNLSLLSSNPGPLPDGAGELGSKVP